MMKEESEVQIKVTRESVVLWLSLFFGVLNVPFAFIAIIDLSSALLVVPPDIPHTAEQWIGFLTAIAAIAGAVAGLTARSHHSMRRKMTHLFIAALGVILIVMAFFIFAYLGPVAHPSSPPTGNFTTMVIALDNPPDNSSCNPALGNLPLNITFHNFTYVCETGYYQCLPWKPNKTEYVCVRGYYAPIKTLKHDENLR